MIHVTVFGASGLVGRVLVERLSLNKSYSVRAVIRSSGNAWGLARSGMKLTVADLSSKEQVADAIDGSTHVVNCVRPNGDEVVTTRNLLAACSAKKIERLVHLSSIAVYGDPPSPESIHETAPPNVKKRTYGWAKLQQDNLVEEAHRNGLSCAVLCPGNITGMRSKYLLSLVSSLQKGRIALVDNGQRPYCSTDVVNLCAAIESALTAPEVDGQRIYINDGQGHTWRDVIDGLLELTEGQETVPSITEEQAKSIIARNPSEVPLFKIFKTIVADSHIRELVRKNPSLDQMYRGLHSLSERLPGRQSGKLLKTLEGKVQHSSQTPSFDAKNCMHQLRNVVPLTDRAERILGYSPLLSLTQSMLMFREWYKQVHGHGDEYSSMLRMLYTD